MIDNRGLGGKRVCPVKVRITNETNSKLNKLATACNMPPATLAAMLIKRSLDDHMTVMDLQKEHNVHPVYRVMPVNINGKLEYMFRG